VIKLNESETNKQFPQGMDTEDLEDSSFDIRLYEMETFTETQQSTKANNCGYIPALFVDEEDAERYDEVFTDLFRVRA